MAVIVGAALAVAAPTAARGPGTASWTVQVDVACATAPRPASATDASGTSRLVRAAVAGPAAVGSASLVRDIDLSGSSSPDGLTAFLGRVAFTARDDAHGVELWITTASSATRLRDIAPGTASSRPSNLTVVGSTLFFIAYDGTHGRELWKSDGRSAGTKMVKDIEANGTALYSLGRHGTTTRAVFRDRLYFDVSGSRQGLWRTGGTAGGTVRIAKKLFIEQLVATSTRLRRAHPGGRGQAVPAAAWCLDHQ